MFHYTTQFRSDNSNPINIMLLIKRVRIVPATGPRLPVLARGRPWANTGNLSPVPGTIRNRFLPRANTGNLSPVPGTIRNRFLPRTNTGNLSHVTGSIRNHLIN